MLTKNLTHLRYTAASSMRNDTVGCGALASLLIGLFCAALFV